MRNLSSQMLGQKIINVFIKKGGKNIYNIMLAMDFLMYTGSE